MIADADGMSSPQSTTYDPIAPPSSLPAPENAPVVVTFIGWDADTDGVAVLHDGERVWSEHSFDSLAQYLRFFAPTGPVLIEFRDE